MNFSAHPALASPYYRLPLLKSFWHNALLAGDRARACGNSDPVTESWIQVVREHVNFKLIELNYAKFFLHPIFYCNFLVAGQLLNPKRISSCLAPD
jgi:hypothetical protein